MLPKGPGNFELIFHFFGYADDTLTTGIVSPVLAGAPIPLADGAPVQTLAPGAAISASALPCRSTWLARSWTSWSITGRSSAAASGGDPGSDTRPRPGVGTRHTQGAVIARVDPGSPAERAGLRTNDLVVAINGAPMRSGIELRNRVGLSRIGDEVELTVERGGAERSVTVRIEKATTTAQRQRQRQR
jgi:membrane-associated protease RseP (regulator of RpoE activity)